MKIGTSRRNIIIYAAAVVFSLMFIIVGNRALSLDYSDIYGRNDQITAVVKILKINDRQTESFSLDGVNEVINETLYFQAEIIKGKDKGELIGGVQSIDGLYDSGEKEVKAGDLAVLSFFPGDFDEADWVFTSYHRTGALLIFGIIFALLLIVFGRWKGLATLVSIGFICAAVFAVFIPAVLGGRSIYLWTVIICVFVISMSLLIVNGPDYKTLTSVLGCLGGVLVSGALTLIMSRLLHLTGVVDEDSFFVQQIQTDSPINLRGVVFAGIVLGALGAIMDVAMSMASSLWEIKAQSPEIQSRALFASGINIGRDMMSTMSSTLILAYIGGSLSTVLLLIAYQGSADILLNLELIVVEIIQALIGSLGILFTIPLTAGVSVILYNKNKRLVR